MHMDKHDSKHIVHNIVTYSKHDNETQLDKLEIIFTASRVS